MASPASSEPNDLPALAPPLSLAWTADLPSDAAVAPMPRCSDDLVAVRCGGFLYGLDLLTGDQRWAVDVGGGSEWALAVSTSRGIVTAGAGEAGMTRVVEVGWDGEERWRVAVEGSLMDDSLVCTDDEIALITRAVDGTHGLTRIARTDQSNKAIQVTGGANFLAAVDGEFWFGSRSLFEDAAGLFVCDGTGSQRIFGDSVGGLRLDGEAVVVACERDETEGFELVSIDRTSRRTTWRSPTKEFMLAAHAGQIAILESDEEGLDHAVLVDAGTGARIWTSDPMELEGGWVYMSADCVWVEDLDGISFYRRSDGAHVDRIATPADLFTIGAGLAPSRFVAGHNNQVICYAGAGLQKSL